MDPETHARKYPHLVDDSLPPRLVWSWQKHGPRTCLDVGSGDGRVLHALERRGYLRGIEVHAVDASPLRISRLKSVHPAFDCRVADACDLTHIADASIDFAICTQVVEHVAEPSRMLSELRRVLTPVGRLYLTTVFKKSWAWYFRKRDGESVLDPTHLREYTDDRQLVGPLSDAGLTVEGSVKSPLVFPLADPLLRCLSPNGAILDGSGWRLLRRPAVRIPGYSTWELLVRRD